MDFLSTLLQLCNLGSISSCTDSAAAVTETAAAATNALSSLGGIGSFLTMLCQLLGIGC